MSEQQTQAASSPAETDVFNGQQPTMAEYNRYRTDGTVPERFRPAETVAESATADAPEETVEETESESDSETEEAQEPPQKSSPAQKRILQLLAEKKDLQRKLEAAAKPDVHSDSSPAQAQQQPQTRTKPTVDATDAEGKPKYATYEDYVEDLADWKAEQQLVRFQQAQQQQEEQKVIRAQFEEAKSRYEDAETVIIPTAQAINEAQIPPALKQVIAQSEHLPDLCYVIGSDPAALKTFLSLAQTNPRAALAQVFEYERGITEELANTGKDEKEGGKAPEKKQTTAPKPPSPVGGGSSRTFDVSDESLSAEEWMRKRNKQLGKV